MIDGLSQMGHVRPTGMAYLLLWSMRFAVDQGWEPAIGLADLEFRFSPWL